MPVCSSLPLVLRLLQILLQYRYRFLPTRGTLGMLMHAGNHPMMPGSIEYFAVTALSVLEEFTNARHSRGTRTGVLGDLAVRNPLR